MSRKTEQKIAKVVSALTEAAETGQSLEDCFLKQAQQWRLTPHQMRLAARAYNMAATLMQLDSSCDREKRAAAPRLVNPEQLIEQLHGEPVEKTAEKLASPVSDDYLTPPSRLLQPEPKPAPRYYTTGPLVKAAGARKTPSVDAKLLEREIRVTRAGAQRKFAEKMAKLRQYFATDNAIDFDEVEANCRALFGRAVSEMLKDACHVKTANVRRCVPVNLAEPPYLWVKEAIDAVRELQMADKAAKLLPKQLPAEKEAKITRPIISQSIFDTDVWTEIEMRNSVLDQAWEKEGGFGSGVSSYTSKAPEAAKDIISPKGISPSQAVQAIVDTANDAKLATIRVKTMLARLSTQDPIISNFKLEDVANVYNSLSSIAPRAMQQEPIAKTFLRMALTRDGVLDAYDLANLQKLNKEIEEAAIESEKRIVAPPLGLVPEY